jgi:cytidylate kinase
MAARRAICISSEPGAGGAEVGRLVAERLGLRYVDEEIVLRASAAGAVPEIELVGVELGSTGPALPPVGPAANERYVALIKDAVQAEADAGDVVIHAHGGSILLGGRPGVLRILVTASPQTREQRIAAETGVSEHHARHFVRESEFGRADYLRRFFGVERELSVHYDLVVNTDAVSVGEAAAAIALVASGRED